MPAFRLSLTLTGLMMAGFCYGQVQPLTDPVEIAAVASEVEIVSPRNAPDEFVPIPLDLTPAEPPHAEGIGSHGEHRAPEESHPGAECQSCTKCKAGNGEKHCEGVCRDPGRPRKPIIDKPGDRNRGDCPPLRYRMSDQKRAGNPHCVAKWARCSVNKKYSSWFVGGGAAFFRGRCRKPSEGTWGLDYDGMFGHVNNWLTYTRGLKGDGRKQGGEGAYETDGEPKLVSRGKELLHLGH